jgi:hypothetical protein
MGAKVGISHHKAKRRCTPTEACLETMLRKRTENEKIDHNYSVILGLISGKQARFNIHVQFRLQCGLIPSFIIELPVSLVLSICPFFPVLLESIIGVL